MKTEQQQLIDKGYIEGKKSFEYLCKEIHDNFNWNKVHRAMVATRWEWYLGKCEMGNNYGIPNIATIKNTAYRLLKMAYEEEKTISGGGFCAGWENGELYLAFTLEEYSACPPYLYGSFERDRNGSAYPKHWVVIFARTVADADNLLRRTHKGVKFQSRELIEDTDRWSIPKYGMTYKEIIEKLKETSIKAIWI